MLWRCKVCGYEYEGEEAPYGCPICNVGRKAFVRVDEQPKLPAEELKKRWKCKICDYIYEGDEPPDVCPICGKGKEVFVLLEHTAVSELSPEVVRNATEGAARSALEKVSYGLYVLTARHGGKMNGQIINTVCQLTATPLQISICVNKDTLTHELIMASGVFAVSVLGQEHLKMVRQFGYQSGRETDKFAGVEYVEGANGCPLIKDSIAFLECSAQIGEAMDVGTHTLFIAKVTNGSLTVADKNISPLTYEYYQRTKLKV